MTSSLFGRIARHPRRTDRDEHEDRLTEIFAAVLDQPACSGLAQHIVESWITEALSKSNFEDALSLRAMGEQLGTREWSCDVRTQTSTVVDERRRRPDLELRFSSPGAPPILVCIEVKHGTKPHTYQLLDYVADLEGRYAGATQVFLVAPRASYPFDESQVPPSVPEMTWQSTALAARSFEARSELARLLVDELMIYLREEGLMDPGRVTPEHLVAIAHYHEARDALDRVYEIADVYVSDHWARRIEEPYSKSAEIAWTYPTRPNTAPLTDWTFSWNVFPNSETVFRDGARPGVPRLAAGARADPGKLDQLDPARWDALVNAGFEVFAKSTLKSAGWDWVWRLAYPEDVIAGASLEAQGEAVGKWIVAAFEEAQELLSAPPA